MNARPVIAPDGTRYATSHEAAAVYGVTVPVVRKWASKGIKGWAYADVPESLTTRVLGILASAGSHGATSAEMCKILYGGYVDQAARSRVAVAIRDLQYTGRVTTSGEKRAIATSSKSGLVYVIVGKEASNPPVQAAVQHGAGNIRHEYRRRKPKWVDPEPNRPIAAPDSTPPDVLDAIDKLIKRGFSPVVPLRGRRVLVESLELPEDDAIALALREVTFLELREGGVG